MNEQDFDEEEVLTVAERAEPGRAGSASAQCSHATKLCLISYSVVAFLPRPGPRPQNPHRSRLLFHSSSFYSSICRYLQIASVSLATTSQSCLLLRRFVVLAPSCASFDGRNPVQQRYDVQVTDYPPATRSSFADHYQAACVTHAVCS